MFQEFPQECRDLFLTGAIDETEFLTLCRYLADPVENPQRVGGEVGAAEDTKADVESEGPSVKDVLHPSVGDHAPLLNDADSIAHVGKFCQDMAGEHDGLAHLLKFFHQHAKFDSCPRV